MKKFQRYKDARKDLKMKLCPSFPLRDWNDVTKKEKSLILKHFIRLGWCGEYSPLSASLDIFQNENKVIDIGILEESKFGLDIDFDDEYHRKRFKALQHIFSELDQFFLLDFLSVYINELIKQGLKYEEFLRDIENIFSDFRINVTVHNLKFIPRQSKIIIKSIYEPVLDSLQGKKYEAIDEELSKAFKAFHKKNYDDVITKSMNAIQAYLQILIYGKVTKKKGINDLLKEAQKKKIIPNSELVSDIYQKINSFLEIQRKHKSGVYPTDGKATPDEALLVLNLSMVLLQSFLTYKK